MERNLHSKARLWAGLVLGGAVATTGLIAIASADGARHSVAPAIKGCSSSNPCLQKTNTGDGPGIEGTSNAGAGIEGNSTSFFGVVGSASGFQAGVAGYNSYASGGASGVYGFSQNGPGVTGSTGSSSSYAVQAEGNVLVVGEIYTKGSCSAGCSRTRGEASFGARTSEPTIDDIGEASTREGVARVNLARDFANAIDPGKPYLVLLTPEGDAALYVTNRSASGFEVRQVGGGRSSVAFAYRIVAKPFGVTEERLPFKSIDEAR